MKYSIFAVLILFSTQIFCQTDSVYLIPPTGKYAVGTMTYEWMDESRDSPATFHKGDKRFIIVQLWYPSEVDSNAIRAPYSALSKDYQNVFTNSFLRPSFSSEIENSNLIIISPGRGTERFLYTTIAEELASHGYTVASVDMPHIGYVLYQDGLIIKPSSKYKPPRGMMGGPYEKVDRFFEEPTQLGYEDLQFAVENIMALNAEDPNQRFIGKINTKSIGLFGHSLGGRIAGKFAFENKSVKAYISMEGIPPRDIRYQGKLNIPVAMLCSSGTWPYAKDNYFSLIDNRKNPVYMIELVGFGHNSVTDNPMIYPESFNYKIDTSLGLKLSRKIILQYFNSVLQKQGAFDNAFINMANIKFNKYK